MSTIEILLALDNETLVLDTTQRRIDMTRFESPSDQAVQMDMDVLQTTVDQRRKANEAQYTSYAINN